MKHKIRFFALLIFIVTLMAIIPFIVSANECEHNITHVEAVEPSCHSDGNIEYWYCSDCEQYWQDEGLTMATNRRYVVLAQLGGILEYVHAETVMPCFTLDTNCWYCAECDGFWLSEDGTVIYTPSETHHNITHVEAVKERCHYEGNIEYWYCADCDQYWVDEGLTMATNRRYVVLAQLGGEMEHIDAVEPTCTTPGNIEYLYCEACGLKTLFDSYIPEIEYDIPALGHNYVDGKCTNCGEEEPIDFEFEDVKPNQWYTEAIYYCYNNGYMVGISETTFGYKDTVTRAMFVTILAKIDGSDLTEYEGKSSFSDVKTDGWYTAAIEWAYQNGYAAGLGDGIFGYKNEVSREQIAMFFYTYSEKNGVDVSAKADISGFADYDRIHDYAQSAMAWAVDAKLIAGTGEGYVSPRASATRSEIAVIVMNYTNKIKP